MFNIPAIPPLEGFHPFVVHFAVGILLSAWVPMLLGVVDSKRRREWFRAGLMMVVMGTLFLFASVYTGEATERVVDRSTQVIEHAVHEHEQLGELARNLFIGVTVIYLGAMLIPGRLPESKRKNMGLVGGVLVAISYGLGSLALANAGHQGGLLVHLHGLQAPVPMADRAALDEKSVNHKKINDR